MQGPWTHAYGLGRSLLATGTLLTLLVNSPEVLFAPGPLAPIDMPEGIGAARYTLFVLLREHLDLARWLAVFGLLVCASGWRPRLTGVLHWWLSYSFFLACVPVDGGDQITSVLTLLLVPISLTDRRRWHWEAPGDMAPSPRYARLLASSALLLVRLQVAWVYLHAAVGKMHVPEWANGTAVWYWFLDPHVGAPRWSHAWLAEALSNTGVVVALTWGTILWELMLRLALTMPARWRLRLLLPAIGFHGAIVLVHGLVSFFFAMFGALVLYLWPRAFDKGAAARIRHWGQAARTHLCPLWHIGLRKTGVSS